MDSESLPCLEENRINRQFHENIIVISGNNIFREIYERTLFPYWNLRAPLILFSVDDKARMITKHHELLSSIELHNPGEAERLARAHAEETFEIVREALS